MKKILTLTVLLTLSATVFAGEDTGWIAKCKSIESLATSVMQARQLGARLSQVIDVLDSDDPAAKDVATALALAAWDRPDYDTPAYEQSAIEEFANQAFLECATLLNAAK